MNWQLFFLTFFLLFLCLNIGYQLDEFVILNTSLVLWVGKSHECFYLFFIVTVTFILKQIPENLRIKESLVFFIEKFKSFYQSSIQIFFFNFFREKKQKLLEVNSSLLFFLIFIILVLQNQIIQFLRQTFL